VNSPTPAGPEARTRWFGLWDGYLAVVYGTTVVLLLTGSGPAAGRTVAMGLLTLLVPWYAAFGRGAIVRERRTGGLRFVAGLLLGYAVAVAADLTATFGLYAVVPLVVMSLPLRLALPCVLLVHAWPLVWSFAVSGTLAGETMALVPFLSLGAALATFLGLFVTQVARQSRQRAQLIEELRRTREREVRLSRAAGVAAERERLAKEIHDTLAQALTSISTLVQAADAELDHAPENAHRHLRLAHRSAAESLAEARAFVAAGTPPLLEEHTLGDAIRRAAAAFAERHGVKADCRITGTERPVSTRVAVVALRAVQEALSNVAKHAAGARRAEIILDLGPDCLTLSVRDDGAGFEPGTTLRHDGSGHGLAGIRARAAEAGGRAEIDSGPGGTTLRVRVPVGGAGHEEARS